MITKRYIVRENGIERTQWIPESKKQISIGFEIYKTPTYLTDSADPYDMSMARVYLNTGTARNKQTLAGFKEPKYTVIPVIIEAVSELV
jgi:hypothetical protein